MELSGVRLELSGVGMELSGVGMELSGMGMELSGMGWSSVGWGWSSVDGMELSGVVMELSGMELSGVIDLIVVLCTFSFETHSTKSGVACPHFHVGCALILPCVPTDVRQRCNDAVSGKPTVHCHRLSATDGDGVP